MNARRRQILDLALPIIGGMASQTVLNLVDTAMVGRLGNHALAGVGMGSFMNFVAVAFLTGLSAGVQAMASRRYGEGRHEETAVPLNGGLLVVLCVATPLTFVFVAATPAVFAWLVQDPGVVTEGVPYLQARLYGMVAVGANFAFRGFWNGVNLSRIYMRTLLVMHACNISISYVLIFGGFGFEAMGAEGAGLGTTIAVFIGLGMYMVQGWQHARSRGFLRGIPARATLVTMMRVAWPSGVQQLFFAGGMTAFLWIIGQVGTPELAAANVLINLVMVGILPGIGFGLAAATLVGQALGRGQPAEAKCWGFEVARFAAVVVGIGALPGLLFPELLIGIFVTDPATVELGRRPLQLVAAGMSLETFGLVLMHALSGAGATRTSMRVSVTLQWAGLLPIAYVLGPVWGGSLMVVWTAHVTYRLIQSGVFAWLWQRGAWAGTDV